MDPMTMYALIGGAILPQSLGLPPMLTIMALAKRIARNIIIEKG